MKTSVLLIVLLGSACTYSQALVWRDPPPKKCELLVCRGTGSRIKKNPPPEDCRCMRREELWK